MLSHYFPFKQSLSLGYTGIEVMIIQRAMQVIGWFEPDANYKYGTFDEETYNAALNAPWLVLSGNGIFDGASYLSIFQASTSEYRKPQWLIDLQEYSAQHKIVQIDFAKRASAEIEVKIKNGGPSGNHYGRADVLKKGDQISLIWEIKHYNNNNLDLGKKQLDRYISAWSSLNGYVNTETGEDYKSKLIAGYNIDTYCIPYTNDTCLEISSTNVKGLVFYRERELDSIPNELVYEYAPFPESEKDYEFFVKPLPCEYIILGIGAIGSLPALPAICSLGGELIVLLNGIYIPLQQALSYFEMQPTY